LRLWIKEQANSGLTQKAFCAQKGIDVSQLSYYKAVFKCQENPSKILAPIKLKETPIAASDIFITFPNGVR
jgi:hypothetical protein